MAAFGTGGRSGGSLRMRGSAGPLGRSGGSRMRMRMNRDFLRTTAAVRAVASMLVTLPLLLPRTVETSDPCTCLSAVLRPGSRRGAPLPLASFLSIVVRVAGGRGTTVAGDSDVTTVEGCRDVTLDATACDKVVGAALSSATAGFRKAAGPFRCIAEVLMMLTLRCNCEVTE